MRPTRLRSWCTRTNGSMLCSQTCTQQISFALLQREHFFHSQGEICVSHLPVLLGAQQLDCYCLFKDI